MVDSKSDAVRRGRYVAAVADAQRATGGREVHFARPDGAVSRRATAANEPESKGTVSWISTAADDETRTVKVRVDLPNADGRLRANTFGTGRIVLREEPKAIVVPSEAIHWDGTCNVVFVRDKNFLQAGCAEDFSRPERAAGREGRRDDRDHRRLAAGRSDRQQEQRGAGSAVASRATWGRAAVVVQGK